MLEKIQNISKKMSNNQRMFATAVLGLVAGAPVVLPSYYPLLGAAMMLPIALWVAGANAGNRKEFYKNWGVSLASIAAGAFLAINLQTSPYQTSELQDSAAPVKVAMTKAPIQKLPATYQPA